MKIGYVVLYVNDPAACLEFWTQKVGMVKKDSKQAGEFARALSEQIDCARTGWAALQRLALADRQAVLAHCDDALAAVAHLCLAWAWTASARAVLEMQGEGSDAVGLRRLDGPRYGLQWVLPHARVHWDALVRGAELPALSPVD